MYASYHSLFVFAEVVGKSSSFNRLVLAKANMQIDIEDFRHYEIAGFYISFSDCFCVLLDSLGFRQPDLFVLYLKLVFRLS